MLKFTRLGVALAVLTTGASSLLASPLEAANQARQTEVINAAVFAKTLDQASVLATSQTNSDPGDVDRVKTVVGLTVIGTGVAVIAFSAARGDYSFKFSGSQEKLTSARRANPRLQKKLLRLLHDDREAANRLLARAKVNHPDRSADWVVEKVIYDLERDRGRY